MEKILVTGAGGFIGSHLTEALVRAGARVRVFVRYTSSREIGLLKEVEIIQYTGASANMV